MKRVFILTILLISQWPFQQLQSQGNFIEGLVITSVGDTLNGYIDFRNRKRNPESIQFKPTEEADPISYGPSDVLGFSLGDQLYRSEVVDVSLTSSNINLIQAGSEIETRVYTVFLRILIDGEKSLFEYIDPVGIENYYIDREGVIELLHYRKFFKIVQEKKIALENNRYLGQLALYLSDCPHIKDKLEQTSYHYVSLMDLMEYYYECTSSIAEYRFVAEKPKLLVGFLGGASQTKMSFNGTFDFIQLIEAELEPSNDWTAGMFLNISLPWNLRKWTLCNEVMYSQYQVTGEYVRIRGENYRLNSSFEFKYSYLKLNTLLRYQYPLKGFSVFIDAGVSNGLAQKQFNRRATYEKLFENESRTVQMAVPETRSYERGFLLGVGAIYDRFSFEMRLEKGNGMSSNDVLLNSSVDRFSALIAFRL